MLTALANVCMEAIAPSTTRISRKAVFRQVLAFLLLPQPLDRCEPDTTPRSGGPGSLFLAPPGQIGNVPLWGVCAKLKACSTAKYTLLVLWPLKGNSAPLAAKEQI